MISIVAVDKNWGIGLEGDMPWRIPGEQKFFKEMTMGKTIVMGRKTLLSLPGGKPLKGRRNIVLTRNPDFDVKGAETALSPSELFEIIKNENPEDVFLIGGAAIYELLTPYCHNALVAKIDGEYRVDTYHPNLDMDTNWRIDESDVPVTSSNGVSYTRYVYKNLAPADFTNP